MTDAGPEADRRRPTVAVIGPGAIGAAVAGALVQAGSSPLIAARTAFGELTVRHPEGTIRTAVDCRTSPSGVDPVDVAVLTVKAHQTDGARDWLRALVGPTTTLVVAQNGVEHRERVAPLIPAQSPVVPAVIWCPAERSAPGVVEVTGAASLVVPADPGGDRLAALLDGSFFGVRLSRDSTTRAWDKLMVNAALGGLGVLTGRTGSDLAREPELQDLMLRVMAEIVPVARAEGAAIDDERPAQILDNVSRLAVGHLSSIAVDRRDGRPTEWEARNDVVGRVAARHGLEVPLNRWLTALIRFGEPATTA